MRTGSTAEICQLVALPLTELEPLLAASEPEGYLIVAKLRKHWLAGTQRFDRDGEALYGAYSGTSLVGVCGRAIDSYRNDPRVARVQKLYVLPQWRNNGIGRALVNRVLDDAAGRFVLVTVRAPDERAALFYERLCFERASGGDDTHLRRL
jgi:GNAT superfamily N-acetyltransferase